MKQMPHPILALQAAGAVAVATSGVSVKDLATILGVISTASALLVGAYKLGAFSSDLTTTKRDSVDAVNDVKGELGKITAHMAEEARQRIEWSGWRERTDQRVDDVERRVGKLEP